MKAWLDDVRSAVQPVHLEVEGRRCGVSNLTWRQYPEAALHRGLKDAFSHPREAARRLKALIQNRSRLFAKLRFGVSLPLTPPRDVLGIVFPVIIYNVTDPDFRALARFAVDGPDDHDGLRMAFLKAWGVYGDPNFEASARKLGLNF